MYQFKTSSWRADAADVTFARHWFGVTAMLLTPVALLALLRLATRFDTQFYSADAHLIVVSAIAALALVIAVVAVITARASRHPGLVYLGCGSAGLGIFMLGHGLTTPGVMGQPLNPWVGRLPHLAVAIFALGLFLGSRRVDTRLGRFVSGHGFRLMVPFLLVVGAATATVVADPTLLMVISWEARATDVLSAATIALCLVVVFTHWRRWQLGNDAVQLALTFAAAMTIAATVSLKYGQFARISWWDYHAYLLAGFAFAVYAVVRRAKKSREVADVLVSAFSEDPFEHIVRGYPDALRELVKAVEIKDAYTHGHSQRTARVATELGLRMGLSTSRLRVIARGAYLHDVGKIAIPISILNKPGKLTAEERAVIETHPRLGYEIASGSKSLAEALA
ncbi:MAG: metal dependent phosphohydrolase, partial [Acidimicrobiia bacterium]|nr:metal dependent phosphohydrolase [Acidimicrobiia bacterium]